MRTAALKQTLWRRCHVSQVPLFYRPGGVASSFSMPLYRPFPTQPSSPFSRSRPVCLFLLADGCPYFSLYPLRTQSPSRLETSLPFPLPFPSIHLSISSSRIFFSLYFFPLFLSFIFSLSTSPPSDTAVPSLPRTDAAARCNFTFIVPFSPFPLVSFLDLCSIYLFLSSSPLLNIRRSAIFR